MGLFSYNIEKYSPKQLVIIPMVLLAISLVVLAFVTVTVGMPVKPGIDFSGGTAVTVITPDTSDQIRTLFADYPLVSISEGLSNGKFITFATMDDAKYKSLTTLIASKYPDARVDQIGESFGKTLQDQAFIAMILAFIGMAIVVFVSFRTFVPSCAVVLSAFADMVMTAAMMNVVGISLSLGTTAALLMLIGYSVDSDILLTTRVLKRQGKLNDKLTGAFHTGIIMTSTTLAAVTMLLIVSWLGQVQVIEEISAVLLIGLIFDILNTWLTNVGILKWYVLKGGGK
ncbi:protein translocase subunit SecF [Methanoregula sp.]|jgi:preprotein translocase subunit SecF|uniref:protein translocase subunit SecF n=1 Tax=Methanoregula sp. TaxID=2052170 RepID=UPI0025D9D7C4|nr:protein translocase subunit SecF [Methanoregula sp.]